MLFRVGVLLRILFYVVTYLYVLISSVGEERAACFYYRQGNMLFLFGEIILPICAQDRPRYFCGTPFV